MYQKQIWSVGKNWSVIDEEASAAWRNGQLEFDQKYHEE
jgi:hypothetical protein